SPMLASEWLPPFPGGPSGPTGFLQRISTSGYPIVSFLSGFILTLYAGLHLNSLKRALPRADRSCHIGIYVLAPDADWAAVNTPNDVLIPRRSGPKITLMRPVEFDEALAAGTRLTLFSYDKSDCFFRVSSF
ncbi:MAG TPA: hypothetical protein VE641_08620, partial [Chthoniobacterales bacterium]|nr:hypothetical protein [Chthoniobacterales bacterium]